MPRPGPRRPLVALRLGDAEITQIDQLAVAADLNRSEMIRRMLAFAAAKMPPEWRP